MNSILNIYEVELEEHRLSDAFEARAAKLAGRIDAKKLGCSLVSLKPGQKAWPFHLHHVNEEMFLVLEGEGILRLDGDENSIRRGDLICIPPGPRGGHQIVNSSESELRYLAVSTMEEPEVTEFPDSGKVRIMVGSPPGGDKEARTADVTVRREDEVDFLHGETQGEPGKSDSIGINTEL